MPNQAYAYKLKCQKRERQEEKIKLQNVNSINTEANKFYHAVVRPEIETFRCKMLLLQNNMRKPRKCGKMKPSGSSNTQDNLAWIVEALRLGIVCRDENGKFYLVMPTGEGGTTTFNGQEYPAADTTVETLKQRLDGSFDVVKVQNEERIYVTIQELRYILTGELSYQTTVEGNKEGTTLSVKLAKENLTPPGERQKLPRWYTKGIKQPSPVKHKSLTDYAKGSPDYLKR